ALRWWKMAERQRPQRFSFAPILTVGFWSLILLLVWPQPGRGAVALVVAAAIIQLVSPWDPPPAPANKRVRLRYARTAGGGSEGTDVWGELACRGGAGGQPGRPFLPPGPPSAARLRGGAGRRRERDEDAAVEGDRVRPQDRGRRAGRPREGPQGSPRLPGG